MELDDLDAPAPPDLCALANALVWEQGLAFLPVDEFIRLLERVRGRLELQGWALVPTDAP